MHLCQILYLQRDTKERQTEMRTLLKKVLEYNPERYMPETISEKVTTIPIRLLNHQVARTYTC